MRKVAVASSIVGIIACGSSAFAGGDKWSIPPYEHDGVVVNQRDIELRSNGKIWFKLNVVNNTSKPMMVDPDQFQVKLPDGRTMTRLKGVFDSRTHGALTIGPHLSGDVNAEYQVGTTVRKVSLVLTGVVVGEKTLRLPELVAQPADRPWSGKAFQSGGLRIVVVSASPSGKENASLSVKANFMNDTDAPMWIDKSQLKARLPDGSTVPCEMGFFDKKGPKVVQPGRSEEISMEFKVGHPTAIGVVLDGVNLKGAPKLPELQLEQ